MRKGWREERKSERRKEEGKRKERTQYSHLKLICG